MLSQISLIAFIQGKVTSISSTVTITWCQESEHFPGQILLYSRSGRSFRIFISDQLQVMSVWLQEESKSMEPHYRCFQCPGDLGEQSHPEIQNWCLPAFEQRICTCDSDGTDWYAANLKNTTAAKYNQYNQSIMMRLIFTACFSPLNNFMSNTVNVNWARDISAFRKVEQ